MFIETLNFSKKENNIEFKIKSHTSEYQIYLMNIEQKKENNLTLKVNDLNKKQYNFNNFGIDSEGKILLFLNKTKNKAIYLGIFDYQENKLVKYIPIQFINNNNYNDYIFEDKRFFVKKLFTHLSFLHLNNNTNNIFISKKIICIQSLNRNDFIFINKDKNYNQSHYKLDDILLKITKEHIDFNFQLSQIEQSDYILNLDNPKNIFFDNSSFQYGINYYIVFINENKIMIILLIKNKKEFKDYILILHLKYENNELLYINEETFEINLGSYIEDNVISFQVKKNKQFLCCSITYEKKGFIIVFVNFHLKFFKILTSNEFLVKIGKKDENNLSIISDIFFSHHYCIIIINFINLVLINLESLSFCLFQINDLCSFYLNLNEIFKGEYNKCLFCYLNLNKNKEINLIIITKKEFKNIIFNIQNIYFKDLNYLECYNLLLSNEITSKTIDYFFSYNIKNIYFFLNIFAKFYNNHFIYLDMNLIDIFYLKIKKILQNNISNNIISTNLLLTNPLLYSGIFSRFITYPFITLKYKNFITSQFFIENISKTLSYLNDNDKSISIYKINIFENIFIKQIIFSLIYDLLSNNTDTKRFSIYVNSLFKYKNERKQIYEVIKNILINPIIQNKLGIIKKKKNINEFLNQNKKEEILKTFRQIVSNKNTNLFFKISSILQPLYKEKSLFKIIEFLYFLIVKYYINKCKNKENKIFSSFNIHDILYEIENDLSFNTIYKKYCLISLSKINFDENPIFINILCIILDRTEIIFSNKSFLFNDNNNFQINFIYLLNLINCSLQNKIQIKNKLIYSYKEENLKKDFINISDKIYHYIIDFLYISDFFKINESKYFNINYFKFIYEKILINTSFQNIKEKIILDFFTIILKKSNEILNYIISKILTQNTNNLKIKQKNSKIINFLNDIIISDSSIEFKNENISVKLNELFKINRLLIFFISFFITKIANGKGNKLLKMMFDKNLKKEKLIPLSNLFKKALLVYYNSNDIFEIIQLINKDFIDENDYIKMITYLLHLSYFYKTQNSENKILFMRDIIDYIYNRINKEKSINIKLETILQIYGTFDFGDLKFQEKIEFIKKNIKFHKLFNSDSIFEYIRKNDFSFDFVIDDFINIFINEKTNTNILQIYNKHYISFENQIIQIMNDKYNYLLKLIDLKIFFNLNNKNIFQSIERKNDLNINLKKKKISEYVEKVINLSQSLINTLKKKLDKKDIIDFSQYKITLEDKTINNDNTVYMFDNKSNLTQQNKNKDESEIILDNDIHVDVNENNLNSSSNIINLENSKFKSKVIYKENSEIEKDIKSEILNEKKDLKLENFQDSIKNDKTSINSNESKINNKSHNQTLKNQPSETTLKCKYISLKLFQQFFKKKILEIKNNIFRFIKAKFYINKMNVICTLNQININPASIDSNDTNKDY